MTLSINHRSHRLQRLWRVARFPMSVALALSVYVVLVGVMTNGRGFAWLRVSEGTLIVFYLGTGVYVSVLRYVLDGWTTTRWRATTVGFVAGVFLGVAVSYVTVFRNGDSFPLGPFLLYLIAVGLFGAIVGLRYWELPEE